MRIVKQNGKIHFEKDSVICSLVANGHYCIACKAFIYSNVKGDVTLFTPLLFIGWIYKTSDVFVT